MKMKTNFTTTRPQLEDGYTKIANELLEALAKNHPGFTEGQVLWSVLRKTYGWNKKTDKISISQLMKMTGKSRRMVIYAIQNLEAKNMIFVKRCFQNVNQITFNKNYEEWNKNKKSKQYKKLHLVQKVAPSATNSKDLVQHSVKTIQKVAPTKETNTKETIQKKYTSIKSLNDDTFEEIAKKYNVPIAFVLSKFEDLQNYCSRKGKKYKNYKAALEFFVKKDAIERIDNAKKSNYKTAIDASNL